jgi:hypothetical protein
MLAQLIYQIGSLDPIPIIKSTDIDCGFTDLHRAMAETLWRYELRLPQPVLAMDRDKHEISLSTTLSINDEVPSFFYGRKYRSLDGFEELQRELGKKLGTIYSLKLLLDKDLSDIIKEYLNGKRFDEKIAFNHNYESKAKVKGKARWRERDLELGERVYSIDVNDYFIDSISKFYREKIGKNLSTMRKNILRGTSGPIGVKRFLRVMDISPSKSKYPSKRSYKNLGKCTGVSDRH